MNKNFDVVIIGAGAAGLCAAISASQYKLKVAVLEKQQRVGKKILVTGNGRCNLSNADITPEKYHCNENYCFDIMKKFSAIDFFKSLGLLCKQDPSGRIYPYSNTAASVLDALRLKCTDSGVEEICNFCACDIAFKNGKYCIKSENDTIFAKKVIISSGGFSADNSSYIIPQKLGHRINKPAPSLCPIQTNEPIIKSLKGLRISGKASAVCNGRILKSETGEIQFAENSLSGICIFNLSRFFKDFNKNMQIWLDICPDISKDDLLKILLNIKKQRMHFQTEDFLSGLFPKRIGQCLLKNITNAKSCNDITEKEVEMLAQKIKNWQFNAIKPSNWKNAQVTAGGVDCSQISPTLESKIAKGVYFCGEVMDIDGDCGGFNLNWAWSSGYFAGKNAAENGEFK